jgi:divalent metal cation (Fe/Co/Zn/Cd) transporter
MSKPTITRLFVGSLVAIVGGLVLFLAAAFLAVASSSLVMDGPDVTGIQPTTFAWAMVAVAAVAMLVMIGGAIGQFVAWIGAVINTARLEDKMWFILLLVLGLLSFGFIAMLIYVIVGPDGTRTPSVTRAQSPA